LRPADSTLRPYLRAGGGYGQTERGRLGVYFIDRWDYHPGRQGWAATADVSTGAELSFVPGARLYGELGMALVSGGEAYDRTLMIPAQFGLSLDLGRVLR